MSDFLARIVAYPDLSAVEMAELRRAMAADPTLATLFACREEIAASIRIDLSGERSAADDRRLFALFSLYRAGRAGDLTADELDTVAEHADRLEDVLARHPGLTIASEDVAGAAAEFAECWDLHFGGEALAPKIDVDHASDRAERASDRAERPSDRVEADRLDRQRTSDHVNADRPDRRPASDRVAAPRIEHRPALRRQPGGPHRKGAPPRRRTAFRWAVRSAIAISVIAFAYILTQVIERDNDTITVETAEGETRLIELSEGSRIRLLESSVLSYGDPTSSLIRRAELAGRAFFEIAPEERGFIVETSTARLTVLGTSFGVDAPDRLTEVVLTEGRLTVARSEKLDDLVVLEPGQMSRVVAGAGPTAPVAVDIARRLAWTGLFIFQSTPLRDIATHLSDHFSVTIRVEEELADERVTGTFEQGRPLREILTVIAAAVGAAVESDSAGGYVLSHP